MKIDLNWLKQHVNLPDDLNAEQLAQILVKVGIEEESILSTGVSGPLVIGKVISFEAEPQKNGKTINWCQVDVGEKDESGNPKLRGIVCGANNIKDNQKVVVALPGTILPTPEGDFKIEARKTYGHISDGMICSQRELGLGQDHDGILDLTDQDVQVGQNAIDYLGLQKQILEVNITPDRGYEMSYRGIAREYSLAQNVDYQDKVDLLASKVPPTNNGFEIIIDDQNPINSKVGCARFTTRIVENIDPKQPSPKWLQEYLVNSGMRSISLIVDISNFVMLDLGQPIHIYDLDRLVEPIVVRRAFENETLITLDNQTRKLDPEDLLITDSKGGLGKRAIGLAGTMGGLETEVENDTTNVLIEAAYFDPVSIYRTSKRHKLSSEASKRYERTIDRNLADKANQLAVDLLLQYGGEQVKVSDRVGDYGTIYIPHNIVFNPSILEKKLGLQIPLDSVKNIFAKLGIQIEKDLNNILTLQIPSWRPDLQTPIDLVEEIARIYDYKSIPLTLPSVSHNPKFMPGLTHFQKIKRTVANSLSLFNFTEVITYPFVGLDTLKKQRENETHPDLKLVELANPLDESRPYLRSALLQTLLETAAYNVAHNNFDFSIYEIGSVFWVNPDQELVAPGNVGGQKPNSEFFHQTQESLPMQPIKLAGIVHGNYEQATPDSKVNKTSWKVADQIISQLSFALSIPLHLVNNEISIPYKNSYSATINTSFKSVGTIGIIDPKIATNYKLKPNTLIFELNLSGLAIGQANPNFKVDPLSKFPSVAQDFAFLAPLELPVGKIQGKIIDLVGENLESVHLLDVFRGEQIPEGKKSVTFALKIRSNSGTFTPDQILELRDKLINQLNLPGVELRL